MTETTMERRNSHTEGIQVRSNEDGQGYVAVGYAAVFEKTSERMGDFYESIDTRAFNKTLQEFDQVALFNHDTNSLLGRVSNNTLRLTVDERGLRYEIDLPDTATGNEVRELLRRGDLKGSSFGFRTIRDSWEQRDGGPHRTLLEVALHEVSVVVFPAYADTDVALRSLDEWRSTDVVPDTAVISDDELVEEEPLEEVREEDIEDVLDEQTHVIRHGGSYVR